MRLYNQQLEFNTKYVNSLLLRENKYNRFMKSIVEGERLDKYTPIDCVNPGIGGTEINTLLSKVRMLNPETSSQKSIEHPVINNNFGSKFQQNIKGNVFGKLLGKPIDHVLNLNINNGKLSLSNNFFTGGGQFPSLVSVRPSLLAREIVNTNTDITTFEGMNVYTTEQLENMSENQLRIYSKDLNGLIKSKNLNYKIRLTMIDSVKVTKQVLIRQIKEAYSQLGINR